jgi:hypothetical protein
VTIERKQSNMDSMNVYYAAKYVYQAAGNMREPATIKEIERVRSEMRKLSRELTKLRRSVVRRRN